jgi:hypothetical protein
MTALFLKFGLPIAFFGGLAIGGWLGLRDR